MIRDALFCLTPCILQVEFLETFSRQTECVYSARSRLLQVDVEAVLAQQDQLYALMQHLKAAGHLQLLQFYKDISKEYSIKVVLTYAGNKKGDICCS